MVPDALATALRHHRAGELQQAERIYRQILDADPHSSDALYYLAQLASRTGNLPAATELMGRAIAITPESAIYHYRLGNLLIRQKKFDQAVACYQRAVQINPDYWEAHSHLGNALIVQRKLEQAVASFQRVLQLNPKDLKTHVNLGNVLQEQGKFDEAMASYQRALQLDPRDAGVHYNLGIGLQAQGYLDQAVACFQRAVLIRPEFAAAHSNLGNALQLQGKLDQAIAAYQRALQIDPEQSRVYNNLGHALRSQGQLEQAVTVYRRALQIKPQNAEANYLLGNVLQQQGKLDQAVAAFQRAVQIKPEFAEAHGNLGGALQRQGKLDQAVVCYQRALQINPNHPEVYNNLGDALTEQGKLDQAIAAFQAALQLTPQKAEVHYNLGNALDRQGKLEQAVAAYQRALQIKPEFSEALSNLGSALNQLGKLDQAVVCYQRALQIEPGSTMALSSVVHQLLQVCCWRDLADLPQRVIDAVEGSRDGDVVPPFSFLALPVPTTAKQQWRCARRWVDTRLKSALQHTAGSASVRVRRDDAKITLGYLSSDFQAHATSWLLAELLEVHDRSRFEVFGYSYGPDDGSPMRRRVVGACDRFRDERDASFVATAERIAADGVDILVDLKGYTQNCRTPILALRPAPIQVNYLGYPGTMGADFMDYILVDDFLVPPEQQPYFTEKLVHLPGCYQVNDSRREISAETPARSTCGLPEKGFVFCSFNNSYKITPEMFDVWMRLLQAVPESVLWLLEANRFAPANLRCEAAARGVAAERLVFAPKAPLAEHLARHRLADLFLDTYPVNAHTTASDALWAGLPLVTLAGETFVSRVAGSLLRGLALPELITHSLEQYESLALQLARDADRLGEIRSRLASNRETSDLFRAEAFARKVEQAYLTMWQSHQAGEKPRCFAVPPV